MPPRLRATAIRRLAKAASVATLMGLVPVAASAQEAKPSQRLAFGKCEAEMSKLVGEEPMGGGRDARIKAGRRLRHVYPKFPPNEGHVPKVANVWVGEALIGIDGKISRVWTLRQPEFTPPWPEFSRAIVSALEQWVYEPTLMDGRPVPVCMTLTMNIDW